MKISVDQKGRVALRSAAQNAAGRDVRVRAAVLLWLADGKPLAPLALAAGVSRPTVYQWIRVWQHDPRPEALGRRGISHRDPKPRPIRRRPGQGAAEPRSQLAPAPGFDLPKSPGSTTDSIGIPAVP